MQLSDDSIMLSNEDYGQYQALSYPTQPSVFVTQQQSLDTGDVTTTYEGDSGDELLQRVTNQATHYVER